MTITRIGDSLRMSDIVIHKDTIYLSGQVGEPGAGAADQTRQILTEIESLLARVDGSKESILQERSNWLTWLSSRR